MKISEIAERLNLKTACAKDQLEKVVTGGYASDLLSDVLAHAREGNLWVTLQTHQNIVAVASAKNISGIILVNGRMPEEPTSAKAKTEGIPILTTDLSTFEIVGELYKLGLK